MSATVTDRRAFVQVQKARRTRPTNPWERMLDQLKTEAKLNAEDLEEHCRWYQKRRAQLAERDG